MQAVSRILVLASMFFLYASFKPERGKTLSVITYNVWNGFESELPRRDAFVQWAQRQQADVIAFEELNNFTQASFAALAATWGHPYAVIVKEGGYPVGISSRYPIANVYKLIDGMHHGCLYAEVKGIAFFVVHFSPFSSAKRWQEADSVIQVLQRKRKLQHAIVLGDFNSFSPNDSLFYTRTGIRDSMQLAEQRNKVLRNLNGKGDIDYRVIHSFLQAGLVDGYSLFHKDFESSYPTKVFGILPESDKITIDHILMSKDIEKTCRKVEIIKDPVTDTLSDHYPVRAIFSQ